MNERSRWISAWESGDIGFHLNTPNPQLLRYWPEIECAPGNTVLVPLCGKSLDMLWLFQQGLNVTGIELSEIAIHSFFSENKLSPSQETVNGMSHFRYQKDNLTLSIVHGDMFEIDQHIIDSADITYDRAALVALPPPIRIRYAELMKNMRQLVLTFEFSTGEEESSGPPFSIDASTLSALYPHMEIECLETEEVVMKNSSRSAKKHVFLLS